jgi:hypothetical protein
LLLTYGTNEHVQSWDGELPLVVDQIALPETRNGFRILVSQRTAAKQFRQQAALVWSVGSNALSRASRGSPLILGAPPREIEIWAASGRLPKYPASASAFPMRLLAIGVEHALDVAVQRSHDADARKHCRPHPKSGPARRGMEVARAGPDRTWRGTRGPAGLILYPGERRRQDTGES